MYIGEAGRLHAYKRLNAISPASYIVLVFGFSNQLEDVAAAFLVDPDTSTHVPSAEQRVRQEIRRAARSRSMTAIRTIRQI